MALTQSRWMRRQTSHWIMPILGWITTTARLITVVTALLLSALLTTFALPVEQWRTGDQHLTELTYRTDPDACLALGLLAFTSDFQIAGISTVVGTAPLEVVDQITTELNRTFPVHRGYTAPLTDIPLSPRPPAHDALAAALAQGPLTVLALGPLTNLATVLREEPALRSQVVRMVAVIGRRPGHTFHPAESADAGILFGHGPIFRDFNFVMDVDAVAQIIASHVPITLIPYDAARAIEMTADDLDRLSQSDPALAWIAERARPWPGYWREGIGHQGFSPFDPLAAAYTSAPSQFACASAHTWVGQDLFVPLWKPIALPVDRDDASPECAGSPRSSQYCRRVSDGLKGWLMAHCVSEQPGSTATQIPGWRRCLFHEIQELRPRTFDLSISGCSFDYMTKEIDGGWLTQYATRA